MNKWLIAYRILSINVVLFTINVVDSASPLPKPTTHTSSNTTDTPNVDSSKPANPDSLTDAETVAKTGQESQSTETENFELDDETEDAGCCNLGFNFRVLCLGQNALEAKLSKVTVNITKTNGNSDYDFKSEGNVNTFTAKRGKVFDTVKDGYCKTIWGAREDVNLYDEYRHLYSKCVEYTGVGTQNQSVTLYHRNNTFTTFTKENNKWKKHSNGTYDPKELTNKLKSNEKATVQSP